MKWAGFTGKTINPAKKTQPNRLPWDRLLATARSKAPPPASSPRPAQKLAQTLGGEANSGPAVATAFGRLEIDLPQGFNWERLWARLDEAAGRHDCDLGRSAVTNEAVL